MNKVSRTVFMLGSVFLWHCCFMHSIPVSGMVTGETLAASLASSNAQERCRGLRGLLDMAPDAQLDVDNGSLRSCLYDESPAVRLAVIAVLEHRVVKDFNADLILLLKRSVTSVRASCAHALGRLSSKEEATLELWRSLDDPEAEVRREVVFSIDLLHGTKMGFMWDQDPKNYRQKAQEALREYLQISEGEPSSHAKKGS